MATIGVDIDNTLYSFEDAAREEYMKLAQERDDKSLFKGAYNPWTEWRSMTDICGPDACWEVIQRVHSAKVVMKQKPYEGAQQVLDELVEDGHTLLFISNRAPESHDATEEWLTDYLFPPGDLVCNFNDKIPQVSHCQFIIDDRPKTLVHFVHDFTWRYSRGDKDHRLGFGLAFPFNQALTDLPRIYLAPSWHGLRHYLVEKGVLSG